MFLESVALLRCNNLALLETQSRIETFVKRYAKEVRELDQEQYCARVKENVEELAKDGWYGKDLKDISAIETWISNFPKGSILPYVLLDSLTIITDDQRAACVKDIIAQIRSSIYKENIGLSDAELNQLFKEHLAASSFVCACRMGDVASSAAGVGKEYKKALGKSFQESEPIELCRKIHDGSVKYVYIVDDFIGTGSQMDGYIKNESVAEHCATREDIGHCSIACLIQSCQDVEFTVLPIVAHSCGYKRLAEKYPNLKIICAYQIGESYDLLSQQCVLYHVSKDGAKQWIEAIKDLKEKHQMKSDYRLNVPFGFEDKFPNNALELYWWTKDTVWVPLLARPEDTELE